MSYLLINGNDALTEFGARMGIGFIEALRTPPPVKDFISNKSRVEDGVRYIVEKVRCDERDVTLPFVIMGDTPAMTRAFEASFLVAIKGEVTLSVPPDSSDVYHLVTVGCASYSLNRSRTIIMIKVKFKEPNPSYRDAD